MKIPKLEYECESNSVYKIVEVALANGLDVNVKEEFEQYVDMCVQEHISYRIWEEEMGEDL